MCISGRREVTYQHFSFKLISQVNSSVHTYSRCIKPGVLNPHVSVELTALAKTVPILVFLRKSPSVSPTSVD